MNRLLIGMTLAAASMLFVMPLCAQDYTHPKEMGLSETEFVRPNPDRMRIELDNGLAAYVARDNRAPLVTLSAFVAAGSAHGAPGEAARVAAALRRGPALMPAESFARTLDRMAAAYSVTMGAEETEVTLDVPAEDAWEAVELLRDVLREPNFGTTGPTRAPERTSQTYGIDWDASIAGAIAAFETSLFAGHAFGHRASADLSDAAAAAAADDGSNNYFRTYFVPSNTVLAVSGDFELEEARSRVAAAFTQWVGGERPVPEVFPNVSTDAPRQVLLADAETLQGWVVIGHEVPRIPEEDQAALAVMDYVLGAYHLDSRLFRESRELRGLTNDNSSFLHPGVRGPGSYSFRTYGRPAVIQLLVDVTFRELSKMRETRPTDDEIFVAKGALVDGLWAAQYATGADAARNFAIEWLREGSHSLSAGYPERIAAVTAAQVQDAAREYLHPERMIVAVVGPLSAIQASPTIESEPPLNSWGDVERIDQK